MSLVITKRRHKGRYGKYTKSYSYKRIPPSEALPASRYSRYSPEMSSAEKNNLLSAVGIPSAKVWRKEPIKPR
jgi:hypothetical protein